MSTADPHTLASTPVIDQPPYLRIDLTGTDHDYEEDYCFILDVGGSDAYANNAGGNNFGECDPLRFSGWTRAAALFDLDTPGQPGDVDYYSVNRSGKGPATHAARTAAAGKAAPDCSSAAPAATGTSRNQTQTTPIRPIQ